MNPNISNKYPKLTRDLIPVFDEYGSKIPDNKPELIPIFKSCQYVQNEADENKRDNRSKQDQTRESERDRNKGTYVGQVCYDKTKDAFIYHVERKQKGIIQNVPGKGIAIDVPILSTVKSDYNVEYVYLGIVGTKDVLVFDIDSFDNEYDSPEGYADQLYATLDNVIEEYPNEMDNILPKKAWNSSKSISYEKAKEIKSSRSNQ